MENGNWRIIVAVLAAGGLGSGGSILANDHGHSDKPDRTEVEHIIETAPPIVALQSDVEHMAENAEANQERNEKQHTAILEAIKALK